jgi:hypothetical protein
VYRDLVDRVASCQHLTHLLLAHTEGALGASILEEPLAGKQDAGSAVGGPALVCTGGM